MAITIACQLLITCSLFYAIAVYRKYGNFLRKKDNATDINAKKDQKDFIRRCHYSFNHCKGDFKKHEKGPKKFKKKNIYIYIYISAYSRTNVESQATSKNIELFFHLFKN